jgi:hypothetical protein
MDEPRMDEERRPSTPL